MIQSSKRTIAKTNDCSSLSKQSLINKGYYQDEYLQYFVASSKNVKRSPIINRGYYIRSKAIDFGWCKTIQSDHHNVVLSLGSGYDTSSFHHLDCFFIEFDYADVCRRKSEIIRQQNLYEEIDSKQQAQIEEIYFKSSRYLLIGIDLRETQRIEEILQSSSIKELLEAFLVRASTKTSINFILFNECSLCYLKQIDSDRLLSKLIEILPRLFEDRYLISIHYLGYEMYRSLRCRNDFDRFMLKHFSSIGAPIETFLDDKQIYDRFKSLGFNQIELINMKRFWRDSIQNDVLERKRIESIEPFDEWEELDCVCSVYNLTVCAKFKPSSLQVLKDSENTEALSNDLKMTKLQKLLTSISAIEMPIFGHSSHFVSEKNSIRIFGGFGSQPKEDGDEDRRHRNHHRIENIIELRLNDSFDEIITVNVWQPKDQHHRISRLHCQTIPIDECHYFLSGGRTSPRSSSSNVIIKIDPNSQSFQLQNHSFSSIELSNYRHICSLINDRKIIQFGGAIPSQQSIRLYDIESDRMVRIESPPHLNLDRHSSAFTTHSSHSLLLNGGLDSSGHFLESSSLELLDFRDSMTLKCFRIENFDHRLYSHRMRMINENEVLIVGGINSRITSNTIYRIDLRQMKLLDQFQLALSGLNCRDKLLMFHNFALETNGASKFCTIGGGGNCFSFGTHFNPIVFFQI